MAGQMSGLRGLEHHCGAARPGGGEQEKSRGEPVHLAPAKAPSHGRRGGHRRTALPHGNERTGPSAGRGSREGLSGAGGRCPGHRQVHFDAANLQQPVPVCLGALCVRRGVGAADQAAGPAAGYLRAGAVSLLGDQPGRCGGGGGGAKAGYFDRGLHSDGVQRGVQLLSRQRGPGQGVHHDPDAPGQGLGHHRLCGGPYQQRGLSGRPQGVGAHGGLCAAF